MIFFFFFGICLCEIFEFKEPNKTLEISITLDKKQICSGFFMSENESNLGYDVEFLSKGDEASKILYRLNFTAVGKEMHYSFSSDERQEVTIKIKSQKVDESLPNKTGMCRMKLETTADTFNKSVSRRVHIEPAISTLEDMLARENALLELTRATSARVKKLGETGRNAAWFAILYNLATPVFYLVTAVFQTRLLKQHIQQKKL